MEEEIKTTHFGETIPIPEEHTELIKKQFENINNISAGVEIMLAQIGIKRNILWRGIREAMLDKCNFDERTYSYNGETNTLTDIGPNPNKRYF